MSNYQNGKIYRINGNGLSYIGSTTLSLNARLYRHRGYIKENRYCSSSKTICGTEVIELVEDFPCNTKAELMAREYYWYMQIPNCNDRSPKAQKRNRAKEYANWKEKYPESYKKQLERSKLWKQNKSKSVTALVSGILL